MSKELYKDKVEITTTTLIEIDRAFDALNKNKDSYLYKVFTDDPVFSAIHELRNVYKEYFDE